VFAAVVDGGFDASTALADVLAAAPDAVRAEVARYTYAALRNLGRARHVLARLGVPARTPTLVAAGAGLHDSAIRDRVPKRTAIDWVALDAIDGELARAARAGDPDALATWGGWPLPLVEQLLARRGVETTWRAVDASLGEPPRTLRANTLRTTREALVEALAASGIVARPARFAPHALHVEGVAALFSSAPFRSGAFEVQDEASQLIALSVAPPPGGHVVDLCAGAGGKSLALAAALGGRGRVAAFDRSGSKLRALAARARRAGASNISTTVADATTPTAALDDALTRADRVLIDAPCTGSGTLRRNPELRLRLDLATLTALGRTQRALVHAAAARLAPGARLVYATCSLLPEENDDVVDALLAADRGLERVPVAELFGARAVAEWSDADGRALAVEPSHDGPDGMYAAVLRRRLPRAPR
jgi:16S rRNA (cytosine967-C5)-methyltransferase